MTANNLADELTTRSVRSKPEALNDQYDSAIIGMGNIGSTMPAICSKEKEALANLSPSAANLAEKLEDYQAKGLKSFDDGQKLINRRSGFFAVIIATPLTSTQPWSLARSRPVCI